MRVTAPILSTYYTVRKADKIRNGQRTTSFSFMLADFIRNKPNSPLTRLMLYLDNIRAQEATFMTLNFLFAAATALPTILFYRYGSFFVIYTRFYRFFAAFVNNGAGISGQTRPLSW